MNEYFDVLSEIGEYTNEVASRRECHEKGLWHKAVAVFVVSVDSKKVLLQQRSRKKKMWPGLWDMTAGGHVLAGEFGYHAALREVEEELGIILDKNDLTFIGSVISENIEGNRIDRHFNEYYIVKKDISIDDIRLQEDEVEDIKWFEKEDVLLKLENNYDGLTRKIGCWDYLKKYFELTK